jgi:hypothetical protein
MGRGGGLARRTNYGFEKRQKELKRQKKKEKKLEERRAKKQAAATVGVEDGQGGEAEGLDRERGEGGD